MGHVLQSSLVCGGGVYGFRPRVVVVVEDMLVTTMMANQVSMSRYIYTNMQVGFNCIECLAVIFKYPTPAIVSELLPTP
jgi:hypothetical protein